ncbi:MAG: aspartate aminotransferase family protein [Bacteroidota bacterium]
MNDLLDQRIDSKYFFGGHSKSEYEEMIQKAVDCVKGFLDNDRFFSGERPEVLRKNPALKIEDQSPQSMDEVLEELQEGFLKHTISYHHPNYVSHLNCPVLIPSIAGELIAASVNTAIETWDQSTSGTFIEQEVVRWICNRLRYPETTSDGVFTSGGTQSNFMGLLMARDHLAFKKYGLNLKQNGWDPKVSRFRIFCSEKAHFSIKKNAALLGMGYNSVVPIPVDHQMKMKPVALEEAINGELAKGNIPMAVVATMGTTDYGSFDPIDEIADIAAAHDLWLHADGAYGGCYVLTTTHRHLLAGVHRADSVTIDFHKSLFQPVCSSVFLLKEKVHFRYVSYFADYLNPLENRDDEQPDLIEKSIQTTRRFDALKLWVSLKVTGSKVLALALEKVHRTAQEAHQLLKADPYFEVAHTPELSTVVFRYKSPAIAQSEVHNTINKYIRSTLFKTGQAAVATTKLNNCTWLKFTFLNPDTDLEHVREIINKIRKTGQFYRTNN